MAAEHCSSGQRHVDVDAGRWTQHHANNTVGLSSNSEVFVGQGLPPCDPTSIPQSETSIMHQRHHRTLLEIVANFPMSTRQDMICVVAHAKRESIHEPWGMAFSMFDDRIVLGKIKENGKHVMNWCHSIRTCERLLDPRIVLSPMFASCETRETYNQRLRVYAGAMSTPNAMHEQLWPGDLLIGIDGWDPTHFQNLTTFTNYLRTANQFTLVVLRHPQAATSAMALSDPRRYCGMPLPPDAAFRSATAADVIWKQIISSSLMPFNIPHSDHTRNIQSFIPRQVTPDQNISNWHSVSRELDKFGAPRSLFRPQKQNLVHHHLENPLDLLSRVAESSHASTNSFFAARQASLAYLQQLPTNITPTPKTSFNAPPKLQIPCNWRNPWFRDENGNHLPYMDNLEFSPDDGQRAELFLTPIDNFAAWLTEKKTIWRQKYTVHQVDDDEYLEGERVHQHYTVARDFWTLQNFSSFDEWMNASLKKWELTYSWKKKKTQRIQKECETIVHVSHRPREFQHWLRIRRNQWRLKRRKKLRERLELLTVGTNESTPLRIETVPASRKGEIEEDMRSRKRRKLQTLALTELAAIDVILEQEEQERKRRESKKRRLLDILFLFDASLGAPDDVVVHCLSFLGRDEYTKLLCINKTYATALKAREEVWKQLCPSHWILPRRPRKPWHELYFHRLRIEQRDSQKQWDDLLAQCSVVLLKGDHLQTIEKLVQQGEKDFGFTVNYVSSIVCERNSILNLAVIHQRQKVVRWLVDHKQADIESYDRGHFTALLNAAWAGDRQLVRFLLQRGANRTKIGFGHYSKALAHPDFKGLTAEGWARKRGHGDVADLIRVGL